MLGTAQEATLCLNDSSTGLTEGAAVPGQLYPTCYLSLQSASSEAWELAVSFQHVVCSCENRAVIQTATF